MNSSIAHQSVAGDSLDPKSLVQQGVLTARALEFLEFCVSARLNVAICGPPGSGKRILLQALISAMAGDGQILAIQNPEEPSLESRGVTSLRAHLNPEDESPAITRHYLLTLVPKMHPTGLILDRVEGAEVVPLLQLLLAMDGILFSIVAESPQDALLKIEDSARRHGQGDQFSVVSRILSAALPLIVQLDRPRDGSPMVVGLTEVAEGEEGSHVLRDIFACQDRELPGEDEARSECILRPTGVKPLFLDRIQTLGATLPEDIFT